MGALADMYGVLKTLEAMNSPAAMAMRGKLAADDLEERILISGAMPSEFKTVMQLGFAPLRWIIKIE